MDSFGLQFQKQVPGEVVNSTKKQTWADAYAKDRFTGTAPVLEQPGQFEDTGHLDARQRFRFMEGMVKQITGPRKDGYALVPQTPGGFERKETVHTTLDRNGNPLYLRTELCDDSVQAQEIPRLPNQNPLIRQRTPKTMTLGHIGLDDEKHGPLSWVEDTRFQVICGAVIFTNAIIIGLETDYDYAGWWWVEQALLIFFCFELTIRLCRHGLQFFQHEDDWVWNLLDFGIVLSGVFDQWTMPAVKFVQTMFSKKKESSTSGKKMTLLFTLMRMLRLLRIVRLFRLVRIVRPLYQLAQGVLEALQGMFWVMVFMVMTLYAAAILCTRFIGHGAALTRDMRSDEEIQEIMTMFGSVPESMFTLFGTMTSWSLLKFVPLFEETPVLRPMFVLFYVYSAWALLAVMTGVVSENLIAIRDQMMREDEEKEKNRKQNITRTLTDLFAQADTDGSGEVNREEFDVMLRDPALMKLLTKNTNLRSQDLQDLFEWLDHDGGGTITVDEFMEGFKWVNEPLCAKSLVKLQERLILEFKQLENKIQGAVEERYTEVHGMTTQPLRKIHAISEQIDNLGEVCSALKFNLLEESEWVPTLRQLTQTEISLHGKIDEVFQRINFLQRAVPQD